MRWTTDGVERPTIDTTVTQEFSVRGGDKLDLRSLPHTDLLELLSGLDAGTKERLRKGFLDLDEAERAHQLLEKARDGDMAAFCEYCFRDTRTGERWEIYDYQREWIDLLNNEDRLVIFAPTSFGKSDFISTAYPVWLLGNNPNELIITISDTDKQAVKFLVAGASHILTNPKIKDVFPNLKPLPHPIQPSRPKKWSEERGAITIDRSIISKDCSWQAIGSLGAVLGSRATRVILDDVIDYENSRTEHRQRQIIDWVDSELMSRFSGEGVEQVVMLGTAWVEYDMMHEFAKRNGFKAVRYSVESGDAERGYRLAYRPDKKIYLMKRREELPPAEYDRQFRNVTRKKTDVTFPSVAKCFHFLETDRMGGTYDQVITPAHELSVTPSGLIEAGVDLSSSKRPGNAIVINTQLPDSTPGGAANFKASRIVRHVFHVKFRACTSPQLAKEIEKLNDEYGVNLWRVENNAYQEALKEWMEATGSGASIRNFTTGKQKADPEVGLPSLENEFHNGGWVIYLPAHTREVVSEVSSRTCDCDYCRLALELTNHPNHRTNDGVMALWFSRGVKQRRRKSRLRTYNLKTKGVERPKASLRAYRIGNRVTKSRGVELPPNAPDIVRRVNHLTIGNAKKRLNELHARQTRLSVDEKNLAIVLEDMLYFCETVFPSE